MKKCDATEGVSNDKKNAFNRDSTSQNWDFKGDLTIEHWDLKGISHVKRESDGDLT